MAEIISDVTEPITVASEPLDENRSRRQQIQVGKSDPLHFQVLVLHKRMQRPGLGGGGWFAVANSRKAKHLNKS